MSDKHHLGELRNLDNLAKGRNRLMSPRRTLWAIFVAWIWGK